MIRNINSQFNYPQTSLNKKMPTQAKTQVNNVGNEPIRDNEADASFGRYIDKHTKLSGGPERIQANPACEAQCAGIVIVAFFDWAFHGFD